MPQSWLDNLYDTSKRCSTVEGELEDLKYWVQDVSNEVDKFIEDIEYEAEGIEYKDGIVSVDYIMKFVKELQTKLAEKKNTVMGYK